MRLVVLMRPSVSSTTSSSSSSISDGSVRVATQSDRVVVVVLVVVEGAKVRAAVVDRRHSVSWEAVVGPQVACVGFAVSGATIDQMSNSHGLVPSVRSDGDAGQVRCSPGFVGFRERVWRTGPVLRDLSSHLLSKRPVFGLDWLHRVFRRPAKSPRKPALQAPFCAIPPQL